jgi:hypothetical protein
LLRRALTLALAAVLAGGILAALPAPAGAAGARGTEGPRLDAGGRPVLPATYSARAVADACRNPGDLHAEVADRVVVHYVRTGRDAVPRTDRDRSGVPDYVECTAAVVSRALALYAALGYRMPAPDRAGGDGRPDVYLVREPVPGERTPGRVLADRRGRHFMRLSTRLGPSGPPPKRESLGPSQLQGLWWVASHEAFHLVQSAYLPVSRIPRWIAEGTADAGMLAALYDRTPSDEYFDIADSWAGASWRSLTSTTNCSTVRCYGGFVFWVAAEEFFYTGQGSPTRSLLEALAAARRQGRPVGTGAAILDRVLREQFSGSLDYVMVRLFVNKGILRKVTAYPLADRLGSPAGAPASATFAAQPLSATRIPVSAAAGSTAVITVRSRARSLYPLLHLDRPEEYVTLADHDDATGLWTYRVPAKYDPSRCGGADCPRGTLDLVVLNTSNRPASYTVTVALEASP